MPGSPKRRTPGSNGAARSFCRTRRCIRSPNGAGSASAAPTCRRSGGLRTSKARWRKSSSIRRRYAPLARAASRHAAAEGARAPTLAPEELRRRQLAALTNWVMAGAKVQPVVLAFEDLHWADPTTLDVLRGIAEQRRAGTALYSRDDAAGIPPALEHALASRHYFARPARSRPGARHGGRTLRPPRAATEMWWKTSPLAPAACRCSSRR